MRLLAALLALAAGCTGPAEMTTPPDAPNYYRDVEPIVHERCARCHQPDDVAPFSLLELSDLTVRKVAIGAAVASKRMPPMPAVADGDCPSLDDPRVMPDAEREVIARWLAAGAPAGEERPPEPPPSMDGPLGPPTDTFAMAEEYQAAAQRDDDYRCFVIDPQLTQIVPVTALSVRPGNAMIVHHAAVYVVPAAAAAEAQQLDASDPAPGYSCFGGVGIASAYAAGLWVPGLAPVPPPRPGLGGWLPPHGLLVMQVHYNFGNAMAFVNGNATDRSSVVVWRATQPVTEVPASLVLGDWTIDLPAGEASVVRSVTGPVVRAPAVPVLGQVTEGLIYTAWGHEHLLGKSFRIDLVHSDGSSQCLLHIPSWDFHWQGMYPFKEPVAAHAGDQVKVTCEWDNSAARYPAGVPPREVHYGETTADEMCIGTLAVMHF
jgi:hypothetical protein